MRILHTASIALTGKDSVVLDGNWILADFANGDTANLEIPNDLAAVAVGKNGNAIYAYNAQGNMSTLTLRLLVGSRDDQRMNSRFYEYKNDPPSFSLIKGQVTKRTGDGQTVTPVVYTLSGGIITKLPVVKENVEGDVEQAVAVWAITFASTDRSI